MTSWAEQTAAWDRSMAQVATGLRRFLVAALGTYQPFTCLPRYGQAAGLSIPTRTVTVQLEPSSDGHGSAPTGGASVQADWGRPQWSAAQIVGKRVRVWETRQWLTADQRLQLVSATYVVDDVVST